MQQLSSGSLSEIPLGNLTPQIQLTSLSTGLHRQLERTAQRLLEIGGRHRDLAGQHTDGLPEKKGNSVTPPGLLMVESCLPREWTIGRLAGMVDDRSTPFMPARQRRRTELIDSLRSS